MENTPHLIGNCRIMDKLGQGGMGAVYRARHQTLDRVVAVKLLPQEFTQNAEYVARFLREARAAANLKHPNVVQVYDAGEQSGQYYIVMEYVDGMSLAQRLKNGPMSEAEALTLLVEAAHGLAAAHEAGLVHRDIKPENMLLDQKGALKIADFGLVSGTEGDNDLTKSGVMLGTPSYMSPEQCEGLPAEARSDIYSLGASFFRLVTGSAPFSASTPMGVLYKHKFEPPPHPRSINPNVSEWTSNLLLKMMAKNPDDRFQSAKQLVETVESIKKGEQPTLVVPAMATPSAGMPAAATPPGGFPAMATPSQGVATVNSGMYTPPPGAGYSSAQVATTVQTPTPGTPPPMTPLPGYPVQPPAKRSGALTAVVVLFLLAAAGGGGYFAWFQYHETKVADARERAEDARRLSNFGRAIEILDDTLAKYPQRTELKDVRNDIEVEWVRADVAQYKKDAEEALGVAKYQQAVGLYDDALALYAEKQHLTTLKPDALLPDLKKKAEDMRDFHAHMDAGRTSEEEKKYAEAVASYEKAMPFESGSDEVAKAAARRAHFMLHMAAGQEAEGAQNYALAMNEFEKAQAFEAAGDKTARAAAIRAEFGGLMAEAVALEKQGQFAKALGKVNGAASLAVQDVADHAARLQSRIRFEDVSSQAATARDKGDLRQAVKLYNDALNDAPTDQAAAELKGLMATLSTDADYIDAMLRGDALMQQGQWLKAQDAYSAASRLKPTEVAPSEKLREARLGQFMAEGSDALAKGDMPGAVSAYKKAVDAAPDSKIAKAKLQQITQLQQKITRAEKDATAAEAARDWQTAERLWQSAAKLNPDGADRYRLRAQSAMFEAHMQTANDLYRKNDLKGAQQAAQLAYQIDPARAGPLLNAIQGKKQAVEAQQQVEGQLKLAIDRVRRGQLPQAQRMLGGLMQANPQNTTIRNYALSLDTVVQYETTARDLSAHRADAASAIRVALQKDKKDKKMNSWLASVEAWKPRIDSLQLVLRQAWLAGNFQAINSGYTKLRGDARQLSNQVLGLVANFRGKAADNANDKGAISFGGGGRGRNGFGGGGLTIPFGADRKAAAIYASTANSLERIAGQIRRIADGQ